MNYTLKVIEVRRETSDTVTICFKQPGLKKIKYLAGQYLTLIFRINGRRYIRPYSFSSCPGVDTYLEVTVKRVPGGVVSNHINDLVKVGDDIEAMSPMGDFVYNSSNNSQSIYLWGVGSGITPLFSIAKHILNSDQSKIVHLNYGNKNHESTIFLNELVDIELKSENRFILQHFYTRITIDESIPSIIQGRIDKSAVVNILSSDQLVSHSIHYICGPIGLKESVKEALQHYNIPSHQIFTEDFELIKNPKDFEDVFTQQITLEFNGSIHNLEVTKGKSVLEAALNADIELPYSCQTGNCNSCKGRLKKGVSKMIGLDIKREDISNDEYLLCCTYPMSEDVYIEI